MYSVYSESLIASGKLNLLRTELTDIEADAEHLSTVSSVAEHVVNVHLFHESVTRIAHVSRLLLEEVRPHA